MSVTNAPSVKASGRASLLPDRNGVLLSAFLLGSGFIATEVASVWHPAGIDLNNHPAVFAQYAASTGWTADHLGYFVAAALTIAGLLALFMALKVGDGLTHLGARIGVVSAGAALALSAMRYAVDGVVLKRAVDAWVSAPDAEKAARFASAETARWLEEASVSYQGYLLGLTFILAAVLIITTARVPRPIGYLLGLSGLAYLVVGWIVGATGFSPDGANPTYVAQVTPLICCVYLFVVAWRMPRPETQAIGNYPAALAGQEEM